VICEASFPPSHHSLVLLQLGIIVSSEAERVEEGVTG